MKVFSVFFCASFIFAASQLRAVELTFFTGDVTVVRGTEKIVKLSAGYALKTNDIVKTGKKAAANVSYPDGSELRLSENSSIKVGKTDEKGGAPAIVMGGSVFTKFSKADKDSTAKRKVYTPSTVCAVRGTEFNVIVSDTAASRVELTEGSLEVYNPKGSSSIQAGTSLEADISQAPVKSGTPKVKAADWTASKDEEFDADVPEKSQKFKQQNEDFASRGSDSKKNIDKLKRDIKDDKDKDSLEKKGKEIEKEAEKVEDDYYQNDASSNALEKIVNRFGADKRKMRDEFEKLKRESNKVKEQQKRNFEAIQAVKESYKKAYEAIKGKFDEDKQKIKGDTNFQNVKPKVNK